MLFFLIVKLTFDQASYVRVIHISVVVTFAIYELNK